MNNMRLARYLTDILSGRARQWKNLNKHRSQQLIRQAEGLDEFPKIVFPPLIIASRTVLELFIKFRYDNSLDRLGHDPLKDLDLDGKKVHSAYTVILTYFIFLLVDRNPINKDAMCSDLSRLLGKEGTLEIIFDELAAVKTKGQLLYFVLWGHMVKAIGCSKISDVISQVKFGTIVSTVFAEVTKLIKARLEATAQQGAAADGGHGRRG